MCIRDSHSGGHAMPQSGMDIDHADDLLSIASRAGARLRTAGCAIDPGAEDAIGTLAIASDFAIHTLAAQPGLLPRLQAAAATPLPAPVLDAGNRSDWGRLLRRLRHAESTRLVWRDAVSYTHLDVYKRQQVGTRQQLVLIGEGEGVTPLRQGELI